MSKLLKLSKLKLQTSFALLALMIGGLPAIAQLGGPPTILIPPIGLSVQEGGTATILPATVFSLTPILSYQWYNGGKIANATNASLVITNVSSKDAGKYTVKAQNSAGWSGQSAPALLVILPIVNVVTQALQVTSATMTSAGFKLNLNNLTNSTCVIYSSTNLVDWTAIATNTPSGGKVSYVDTSATNHAFRYYKAMTQ